MIVKCPECAHVRSVSEDFIPAKAEFATCPRCGSRFRFRTVPKDPLPKIAAAPLLQEQPPAPAPKTARSNSGDIWDAVNSLNDQWQDVPESTPAKADAPELAGHDSLLPPSPLPSSPLPAATPKRQKAAVAPKKERKGLFSFLKRIEKSATTPAKESASATAESSPLLKAHAQALAAQAALDHSQDPPPAQLHDSWEQELEAQQQPLPTQQQHGIPQTTQQEDLLHPFPAEQHAPVLAQPAPHTLKATAQKTQPASPQATVAPLAMAQPQPEPQNYAVTNGVEASTFATSVPKQQRIRVRAAVVDGTQQPAEALATTMHPVAPKLQAAAQTPAASRPAPPPGSPAAKLLEKARALQESVRQESAALAAQEQQALNAARQAEIEEQDALLEQGRNTVEPTNHLPPQPAAASPAPEGTEAPFVPVAGQMEEAGIAAVASQMPPWAEQVPAKASSGRMQEEKEPSASSNLEETDAELPAMLHDEALSQQEPQITILPQEEPQAGNVPAGALPRVRVRPARMEETEYDQYRTFPKMPPSGKEPNPTGRFLGTLYPEMEDRLVAARTEQPANDTAKVELPPQIIVESPLPSPHATPPIEVEMRPDAADEAVPGSIEEKVAGDLLLMLAPTQRPVRNLGTLDEFNAHDRNDGPSLLQGIPWENLRQAGWFRGFFSTIHMVMFNSAFFYSHITERGSLTPSYLFMLLLGYITLLCSSLWVQALNAFMGEATAPLLTPAFALPTLLLLTPVYLGALQIVTATLIQSILRLSTSEKGQFPLIFKMLGYAFAPLVLSVIPFVGPVAGGVWFFFSLVTGCRVALGLSWVQLAPALLLPLALVGGCVALLFM